MTILNYELFNNTSNAWITAGVAAVVLFVVFRLLKAVIHAMMRKFSSRTDTVWDDVITEMIGRINSLFILIAAIYLAALTLKLPRQAADVADKLIAAAILLQIALLITYGISFFLNIQRKKRLSTNAGSVTTLDAVGFILKLILWTLILLFALDNFGVDVTALVTGLGISGIAVALAVQNILGDLFASFSILLDKPFVVGDFIIIDGYMGTIENVGMKTTRLRSLSGEQLIFSNADLLRSRIRNYKRMSERRVVFSFGVEYRTSHQKLQKIPSMIEEIIEARNQTRFDRAHFKEFGAYALNFEVVYWVLDPDYNIYMDIQQTINLAIFKAFETEEISFAFPTQSIRLQEPEKDDDRNSTG